MESLTIKVLDHGHVRLVDSMGNDSTIVAAARNSVSGLGVKLTSDERGLIRFLMRHRHTTPFEAVTLTFEMKLPIFVARQLVRHRTQSLNELSARYSVLPEEYYVPDCEHIQLQADKNKQGRKDEVLDHADGHRTIFDTEARGSFVQYRMRLETGMARELARINLPLSTYTQWWSTMNLHNAFHLLALRKDPHAQYETRVFADAMGQLIQNLCPIAYEAFEDFRLNAATFSAQELTILRDFFQRSMDMKKAVDTLRNEPNVQAWRERFKTKREADEFADKFEKVFGVG